MRAFLSPLLASAALLVLSYTYLAWVDTKLVDKAVTEFVVAHSDAYKRAEMERDLYTALHRTVRMCIPLLESRAVKYSYCENLLNGIVVSFSQAHNFSTCPLPIGVSAENVITARFLCPLEGRVGSAIFIIPAGSEVRP